MRSRGLSDSSLRRIAEFQGSISKVAQEEGYQGFKNYGTWVVTLWIENDQGEYEYWRERVQELTPEGGFTQEEQVRSDYLVELAQELQDYHEENMPEVRGVYADLLGAALEEVDWFQVADNLAQE